MSDLYLLSKCTSPSRSYGKIIIKRKREKTFLLLLSFLSPIFYLFITPIFNTFSLSKGFYLQNNFYFSDEIYLKKKKKKKKNWWKKPFYWERKRKVGVDRGKIGHFWWKKKKEFFPSSIKKKKRFFSLPPPFFGFEMKGKEKDWS